MFQCRKTAYHSEQFALKDIERIANSSKRETKPIRTYLCKRCNLWHLSSQKEFKDEIIIRLQNELDQKNKEIKLLIEENELLKKTNKNETNIEIRKNEVVKSLRIQLSKERDLIKRLRYDNNDLISKNLQLQKKTNFL